MPLTDRDYFDFFHQQQQRATVCVFWASGRRREKREASLLSFPSNNTSHYLFHPSELTSIMSEPDELYTLRAQYWLGHYQLALDEAKSIARKPMPSHLKVEREEFVLRALLALKQFDKVQSEADASLDNGLGKLFLRIPLKWISLCSIIIIFHPTLLTLTFQTLVKTRCTSSKPSCKIRITIHTSNCKVCDIE
jgi:hypothetical protein